MFSRKKRRLVVSVVSTGVLSLVCASSHAGRSVRSDASDGAFEFLGGFWGSDTQEFGTTGSEGRTEFKLNLGNSAGARYYTVCFSEDGFLKLVTTDVCAGTDYALPPTGNYIAVFATDLDSTSTGFGSLTRTRGFVDTRTPYRLFQAVPAMRYWWSGVTLAGDANAFDVQIVLLDRSKGTNNGDFDIEFNYGNGEQIPPVGSESNPNAAGFRGFKLGPNSRGPTAGPFGPFDTSGAPIRYCFRGGRVVSCN
jgi:hypothetical protein